MAVTNHSDKLPRIGKADIVIGTFPDSSSGRRGILIIKGQPLIAEIANSQTARETAVLWIECDDLADASALKRMVILQTS
jgi:hypothetical protein